MAGGNCSEGLGDDFFEQILQVPENGSGGGGGGYGRTSMISGGLRGGMPLGLNLEQTGFLRHQQQDTTTPRFLVDAADGRSINNNHNHHHHHLRLHDMNHHHHHNNNNTTSSSPSSTPGITDRESMQMRGNLFSTLGQMHNAPHPHPQSVRPMLTSPPPPPQPQLQLHHQHQHQQFQSQAPNPASVGSMPQPPGIRPRVRARRGQATDPHSIAERLRRERIAERMRALQDLVPSINKTDRAAMLDEIVDYVKFLRLQVKVLSMSRLGGAGAVAQLVADVPVSAVEGEDIEGGANQQAWTKWSNDGTEQQVAKLMEEDVGSAMQFLQSKALCIMPISLASAIFHMPQSDSSSTIIKPESNHSHS